MSVFFDTTTSSLQYHSSSFNRLNALEAENRHLREILLQEHNEGPSVPSFKPTGSVDETSFIELSAQDDAAADPEEDPTIYCQTVCQFDRPNEPASTSTATDSSGPEVSGTAGTPEEEM